MIRITVLALLLTAAASARAMPVSPIEKASNVIPARQACGAGMHSVNGVCVRTPARSQAARCAAGMRSVNGRCVR